MQRFAASLALLLCAAIPTIASVTAEEPANQYYFVKVWGADDGFVEGSVTDVSQTPEGYLWVGTLFGSVLRFDGTRFVSYTSANTPGFVSKWGVPRLIEDAAGLPAPEQFPTPGVRTIVSRILFHCTTVFAVPCRQSLS